MSVAELLESVLRITNKVRQQIRHKVIHPLVRLVPYTNVVIAQQILVASRFGQGFIGVRI